MVRCSEVWCCETWCGVVCLRCGTNRIVQLELGSFELLLLQPAVVLDGQHGVHDVAEAAHQKGTQTIAAGDLKDATRNGTRQLASYTHTPALGRRIGGVGMVWYLQAESRQTAER